MQTLRMALKSIGSNKLRAMLTMLGIIIGVMALVILVSLVNGATGSVTDSISGLGSNMLTVTISDNKGKPVYLDDLASWMNEKQIGDVACYSNESMTAKYQGTSESVDVYGISPYYDKIQGLDLLLGRFIKSTDIENHTYVCVINETLASEVIGYTDCIGQEISFEGMKYTVVGVLSEDENLMTSMRGSSYTAYIPYTSLLRLSSTVTEDITEFVISPAVGSTVEQTETTITNILKERFLEDEDAYSVSSMNVMEDAMSSITSVLSILLGGIAAISLIVGGIGIMNIMLVTVTERTREIGIRKAIGADRGTILRQFLMEAVVLCMLGCAIGIFLSWTILRVVAVVVSSLNIRFSLNGTVVLIAVLFCFFIGVVFGLYPANKAARMAPIDALHYGG